MDEARPEVECSRSTKTETSERHTYDLNFAITNRGGRPLRGLAIEVWFPADAYLSPTTAYQHLEITETRIDGKEYKHLFFHFDAMPEDGRRRFMKHLLPGKTFWIFGSEGHAARLMSLEYHVNQEIFRNRYGKRVRWKLHADGVPPVEGQKDFKDLMNY